MAFYIVSAFALVVLFMLFSNVPYTLRPVHPNHVSSPITEDRKQWTFNPARDSRNLGLSDEQCDAAFPGFYTEIDRARDYFGPRSIHQDRIKLYTKKKIYHHSQVVGK
ncbi:hypothetical protein B0J12DRAFT_788533 [Macrophomina phaseolina]|uniref:Uncharacterized protein n=1 Tax=Macrophomina phaseolina TaxID=35725 RepID=A0ABQ8G017_9PEZI|nr:hypothetical protein B0J12DRAFT_788533 [Macrophomina phaseolina]